MSNVAGKAYGMNVVTPMRPAWTFVNRLLFMIGRSFPKTLSGLRALSIIHFARWVIIKRAQWPAIDPATGDKMSAREKLGNDYMLFCSNFNGTWDQYIDAFSDGIPTGLDLFWYASTKYPHSVPVSPFKSYIRANQIDTDYYYNATPGSAQRDIKAALRIALGLAALDRDFAGLTPEAFRLRYIATLVEMQNDLGASGEAPVASNDTRNADFNRNAFQHDPAAGRLL